MKPGEPEPFDSSFTRESDNENKPHGKSKRTVAAVKPGAVSVQPGEPEAFNSSVGAISEKSHQPPSFHASTGAINSSVSRQHGKSKRSTAAVVPGAVSVKGEEPDSFHGSMNDTAVEFFKTAWKVETPRVGRRPGCRCNEGRRRT